MEHLFFNPSIEELEAERLRISDLTVLEGDWPGRETLKLDYSWPQFRWLGHPHDTPPTSATYGREYRATKSRGLIRAVHASFEQVFDPPLPLPEVLDRVVAYMQSWWTFGFLEVVLQKQIKVKCLTRINEAGEIFLDTHYLVFLLYYSTHPAEIRKMSDEEKKLLKANLKLFTDQVSEFHEQCFSSCHNPANEDSTDEDSLSDIDSSDEDTLSDDDSSDEDSASESSTDEDPLSDGDSADEDSTTQDPADEDSADEHFADKHLAEEDSADEYSRDEDSVDEDSADEASADEDSAGERSLLVKCMTDAEVFTCVQLLTEFIESMTTDTDMADCMGEFFLPSIEEENLAHLVQSRARMLSAGFCTTAIGDVLYPVSLREWFVYWAKQTGLNTNENHRGCLPDACGYDKHDIESPAHHWACTNKNDCHIVQPEPDAVYKILEAGLIPFVQILWSADGSEVRINVEERYQNSIQDALAISHVWRQGLGSTPEDGMLLCQLRELRAVINEVTQDDSVTRRLFWIDSLCVPNSPRHRALAIGQINQVFANVGKVVILDASLRTLDASRAPQWYSLASFLTCPWRTRLWTFMEACVSRELLLPCKDRTYNVEEILANVTDDDEYVKQQDHDYVTQMMGKTLNEMASYSRRMHTHFAGTPDEPEAMIQSTHRLMDTARDLRTTHADDEPLVLAIILGLPLTGLSVLKGEARWAELYKTYGKIPTSWLFLDVARLSCVPFFRWAPRSLLVGNGAEPPSSFNLGEVTSHGIVGMFSLVMFRQIYQINENGMIDISVLAEDKSGKTCVCLELTLSPDVAEESRRIYTEDRSYNGLLPQKRYNITDLPPDSESVMDRGVLIYMESMDDSCFEAEPQTCSIVATCDVTWRPVETDHEVWGHYRVATVFEDVEMRIV